MKKVFFSDVGSFLYFFDVKKLQIFTTGLQLKPNMTRSIQKLLYYVTIFSVFIFLTGESFGWGTCIFIGGGGFGCVGQPLVTP